MPIYAYRCASCGHAQDVLQKMSDTVLTVCPTCGAATYAKQLTAAGFQLKGSGWYVTDFRGGNTAAKKDGKDEGEGAQAQPADGSAEKAADKPAEKTEAKGPAETETKPAVKPATAPAPAAAPAPKPATGA